MSCIDCKSPLDELGNCSNKKCASNREIQTNDPLKDWMDENGTDR